MIQHSIRRTSAKGTSFQGVCTKCGREGLTLDDMEDECSNVRGVSDRQVVLEALDKDRMN
jgi:hypothetical protein